MKNWLWGYTRGDGQFSARINGKDNNKSYPGYYFSGAFWVFRFVGDGKWYVSMYAVGIYDAVGPFDTVQEAKEAVEIYRMLK